jgi:hypothetical protein
MRTWTGRPWPEASPFALSLAVMVTSVLFGSHALGDAAAVCGGGEDPHAESASAKIAHAAPGTTTSFII